MLWLRFQDTAGIRIALSALFVAVIAAIGSVALAAASLIPAGGIAIITITGAAVGAAFGVLLGERNESFALLEPLGTRRARAAALRAVRRGPVPSDPAIRHAAYGLARLQLSVGQTMKRKQTIAMVCFAVFFGLLALGSRGWIDCAVKVGLALLYVVLAIKYPWDLRRLADRVPLLAE
ncbi:hypothetical protein [Mycobacterium sp. OTB74]|jgi:hypothetical protein|uniref:hypothetical protein n=1 Tax=Mycobacterium sp. OTB74 TaxID=1853452 RepID=UPI002472FA97|nr:hypothetical protein [Mycobacterium sp. OTB74]MDH6245499.1 hypothetical protein [Mycobacterium sp. OTB74]